MALDEQLELHGRISPRALHNIYNVRGKVNMHPHVKEHIAFAYFSGKIAEQGQVDKSLFNEMLLEYKANGFTGLESILITEMKKDGLSLAQVIEAGRDQVVNLLYLRAYQALDFALVQGAISESTMIYGLLICKKTR
ncbi:hypothetical protein SAMN04487969_1346 [Paenibacillus algorifonticola]|uniref:Uncharacterized protein n=2 Tax=Paenibacillus algorifonticola TaxID=684063 RepID=A0A1I2IH46_9BACL|nr:hypothetical protein SAMN04487969_1346 [Paenibacillus algorifonticola]